MADIDYDTNTQYDVIVIGGGAAGLVSSSFLAALDLEVALVSDGHPGGECLWTGCVPSKALIHAASLAKRGVSGDDSFYEAMNFMKKARETIAHHDSVETIEQRNGVKVITGKARFIDKNTIKINENTMRAAKFIIATGGYQEIPSIDGFDEIGCLTHETILNLEEKPDSLAIVGAGPVGVEYAQTLSRLGVKVCLIEYQERVLPREEPEVSALVESILLEEGVIVHTNYSVIKGIKKENEVSLSIKANRTGEEKNINCRQVMVATGKTPSTKELGLDKVGVERDEKGFIKTDRQQRTSLSHIWACGDVCGLYQFTHYADHTAQIAALNAAYRNFIPFIRRETEVVPWCTFFDPEVASVGMRVKEASDKYGAENIHVLNFDLSDFDRAILDQEARGFMLAVVNKKGKILGATIIGARAGEIIHEFSIAMKNNISITALSKTIHVYPTMSAAVRSLAAQYYKTAAKDSVGLKMAKFLAARLR